MQPFVQAILDVSRFAAALAQWHGLKAEQRRAILAALSDNGWGLMLDCLRHSGSWEEKPSAATLERLTHE